MLPTPDSAAYPNRKKPRSRQLRGFFSNSRTSKKDFTDRGTAYPLKHSAISAIGRMLTDDSATADPALHP